MSDGWFTVCVIAGMTLGFPVLGVVTAMITTALLKLVDRWTENRP